MKYNGVEIKNINISDWEKSEEDMLVWNFDSKEFHRAKVLGYENYGEFKWVARLTMANSATYWDCCSKIPERSAIEEEMLEKLAKDNEEYLSKKIEDYKIGKLYRCYFINTITNRECSMICKCSFKQYNVFYFEIIENNPYLFTLGHSYSSTTFTKIEEYEQPSRLATKRELHKWYMEGNGEMAFINGGYVVSNTIEYREDESENSSIGTFVRKWGDTEWVKPTIDYLGIK